MPDQDPFTRSPIEQSAVDQNQPTPQPQPTADPFTRSPIDSKNTMNNYEDKPLPDLRGSIDAGVATSEEKSQYLKLMYGKVMDSNARDNADALEISKKTGISPDEILNNLDTARKARNAPDQKFWDDLQINTPALARYLEDPQNMASLHNDLPGLDKRDSLIDDLKKSTYSLASGALKTLDFPASEVKKLTGISFGPGYDRDQRWIQKLDQMANDIVSPEMTDEKYSKIWEDKDLHALTAKIVGQLPTFLAFTGTGIVTGGLGLPALAMAAIPSGAMGAMDLAERRYQGEGYGSAIAKSGITSVTMLVPCGTVATSLLRPLEVKFGDQFAKSILISVFKGYAETSLAFAGQGQAQLFANAVVDKATGDDPKAFENYTSKMGETLAGNVVSSALWGSPHLVKGASALVKGQDKAMAELQERLESANKTKKAITDLINHEIVSDKDAKGHSQEAVKAMKRSHPGVDSVIIPTDKFEEFCQDRKPEDVLKDFGDKSVESYANPASSHVEIPLEELLTSGKAKTLLPLIDEMKVNYDVPSVRETKDELDKTKFIQTEQDKVSERRKALEDKIIESVMKTGEAKSKGVAVAKWASNLLDKGAETFGMEFHKNKKSFEKPFINSTPEQNNEVFNQSGMSWDKLNAQKVDSKGKTQADYLKSREERYGLRAAVKDPVTGEIHVGLKYEEHSDIATRLGLKGIVDEYTGFMQDDGTFITRKQGDELYGYKTSGDMLGDQADIQKELSENVTFKDFEAREFLRNRHDYDELNQSNRGAIRVAYDPETGKKTFHILLDENKDQSTLFHECAHAFLYVMRDMIKGKDASPELKQMEKDTLKFLDANSWDDVFEHGKDNKITDSARQMHERFARGFEYRLWEGNVPSKGMKAVYDRFARWIRIVYPTYETMQKYLGVEMTPEMRRVYDRIISTQTDIDDAAQHSGYNPEAPEGLNPEEMHEWTKRHYDTLQEAYDASYKSSFNAYKKENGLDEQQSRIKAESDNIDLHPDEIISKQMQRMTPDPKEEESKIYQGAKERAEKYVNDRGKWSIIDTVASEHPDYKEIAQKILDNVASEENRKLFESIGLALNGEEDATKAASIILHSDKEQEIKDRTDLEMKQYRTPGNANETKAKIALLYGDARSNQLSAEYVKLLNINPDSSISQSEEMLKNTGRIERKQAEAIRNKARMEARDIINDIPSGESLRYDKYQVACKNAAEQYGKYAKDKDFANASKWKYKELLNHELSKLAVKHQDIVIKLINNAKWMGEKTLLNKKNNLDIQVGAAKRINDILSKFNLVQKSKHDLEPLAEFMSNSGKDSEEILNLTGMVKTDSGWEEETVPKILERMRNFDEHFTDSVPEGFNDLESKDHNELTIGELKAVVNVSKLIYKFGRDSEKIESAGKEENFKTATSLIHDVCEKVAIYGDKLHSKEYSDKKEKIGKKITQTEELVEGIYLRSLGQLESIAERIEGKTGPIHNYITRKHRDAEAHYQQLEGDTYKQIGEISEKYFPGNGLGDRYKQKVSVDMDNGKKRDFSILELHNVIRNIGNSEGLQRIKYGNGFSEKVIENMKSHLTEKDMDFIKETCEVREKLWPLAKALSLKMYGVKPEDSEKLKVTFNEKTYDGWHHHLDYDASMIPPKVKEASVELVNSYKNFRIARVDDGFSKTRLKNLNKPLTLDKDVFSQDMNKMLHYVTYAEAVRDVNRLLKNKDVASGLSDALGTNGSKVFSDQNNYLAEGGHGKQFSNTLFATVADFLRWSRINALRYNIAWRPKMYPIKLASDINRSLWEDHNQLAKSLWDYGIVPAGEKFAELKERVNQRDSSMKNIGELFDYNAQQFHEASKGKSAIQVFYNNTAYLAERYAHMIVSYSHEDTVYNNARAEGKSEYESVHLAREFVDNIFGTGSKTHHTMFARGEYGGEFEKGLAPAFQVFASWGNRFYIDAKKVEGSFRKGDFLIASMATAKMFASYVLIPATINWGVSEIFRNPIATSDEERKKRFKMRMEMAIPELFPLAKPLAEHFLNKVEGNYSPGYHLYPGEYVIEKMAKGTAGTYKLAFDNKNFKQSDAEEMLSSALIMSNNPREIDTLVMNGWKHMHQNIPYHWQDVTTPITEK